jgi:hypothetical protein
MFDKAVNNIIESVKLTKEAYDEYNFEMNPGDDYNDGILVSEVLPNDPAGDDVFVIDASITMPYNLDAGEPQSWDSPGSDPSAEIEEIIFNRALIYRYIQASDDYVEVTPEMVGQDVYNAVLAKLKDQVTELAVKDAYDNIDVNGY